MTGATWEELSTAAYDEVWDRFDHRFRFSPSVDGSQGFAEPAVSITFSVRAAFDEDRGASVSEACEVEFLAAVRSLIGPDEFLLALDWQHPAYRFWPHRPVERDDDGDWVVPLIPNGDYFCFVAPDFGFGTLGHPWEGTLCVFGAPLVDALEAPLRAALGAPIRRGS